MSAGGGDIDTHYIRTGDGTRPPVVLLHGLMGSGAGWAPVARRLEAGFDVVMPDARGHGGSSAPAHGYSYEELAGDVVGLIRALGLSAPVLVGHSMGGMTAAVAAVRLASGVRGVVLADPTFLSAGRQREVYESDVVEQHRRLLGRTKREVLADLRARHPHRSLEIVEALAESRLATRLSAFEVLAPPNPDYRELVSAIRVPVLIVIGDRPVVSLESARELQRLNPRVSVEQIQNAGHGVPYDQPDRLAEVVRSFFRREVGSSPLQLRP